MTQPKKPQPKEEEPLKGEALKERAQELDIEGRSTMKADELREAVAEEEGAPKTETPEEKVEEPSEETPRDDEAPLETPESPREATIVLDSRAVTEALLEHVEEGFGAKPPKNPPSGAAATVSVPEIVELYKHVADNPVDSHAPTWVSRPANSP